MSDINTKRSLREVLPRESAARATREREVVAAGFYGQSNSQPPIRSISSRRGRGRSWLFIVIIVVIVALAAGFALSKVFAQATVKVTPVQGRLLLNHTFEAKKSPAADELGFVIMSGLEETEKRTLPTSGSEHVEKKASGKIIISNVYSTKSQKLITNTRFETPDGKIYRIADAITVPGYTKNGSDIVPGMLEVIVIADKAGVEYNIGETTFTIPGFKGDPRFKDITAKSKGSMEGGFVGEMKKIDPAEKEKVRKEMETALRERFLEEARADVQPEFVLFPEAIYISFSESVGQTDTSGAGAEYALTGKLFALIMNRLDLAQHIASQLVPNHNGAAVEIPNLDKLTFKLSNEELLASFSFDRAAFTLEGNALIASVFDKEELIKRLTTTKDNNYEEIFALYPTIDKAEISFRPPWLRSVPKDANRVKIEVILEAIQP